MDMSKYYEYRKLLRELYTSEPYSSNDIGSSIMEIKDKNRCVVSMSLSLGNHYIEAECAEGTPIEKVNKIADSMIKRVGYYLVNNLDRIQNITSEDKTLLQAMITAGNYCDHMVLGNMIKINL